MGDRPSEGRISLVHVGSYGNESPEDLRQMEEREYVKRIKDDMHERQMAYAYRSIHCNNGVKDDPSSNYVTLQASPSADGVEFVTLEEFFVADPSAVYEQIIPPHSPHSNNNGNESQQQNGMGNYMSQTDVQNGGCIIHLEPVLPSHLSSSSYVNLPTEPMPYDPSLHESRVHYINSGPDDNEAMQGRQSQGTPNPAASNHPVPIQIVRPQQLLKANTRSKSVSSSEDFRSSFSSTTTSRNDNGDQQSPSPPSSNTNGGSTRISSRKRGTRTSSLGSSSDEGSLMNLSMSSSDGRGEEYGDDDGGKHRRSKQPVPDSNKDEKYWRRREKNNLAAKRSREARKQKESQTTERAAYLEEQHENLRKSLEEVQRQNEELRQRLSKYENVSEFQKIC